MKNVQSVTKIASLAPPAPPFIVGCKLNLSFSAATTWNGFPKLGTSLNHGRKEILGI